MMRIFETREEIEEAETNEELSMMLMQIQTEYDDKIRDIEKYFEEEQYENVKGQLDQTQYLN